MRAIASPHSITSCTAPASRASTTFCANPDFDFVKGDVREEDTMRAALKNADVIINLAAIVGASACDRDPALATSVNLDAVKLLNRLRSPNQLVVFPNTNSGYGATTGEAYCTEETPLEPISLYGRTKVEAEQLLLNSPNAIAFRLATVFGFSPRMRLDLLVNHFVYAAVKEGYLVLFEKEFSRNFVHVRDVADCMLHALGNRERMVGNVYNLGLDSANVSKEELALRVKQHVPNFYLHFAAIGQDPDKRNYVVSSAKLRGTGFERNDPWTTASENSSRVTAWKAVLSSRMPLEQPFQPAERSDQYIGHSIVQELELFVEADVFLVKAQQRCPDHGGIACR